LKRFAALAWLAALALASPARSEAWREVMALGKFEPVVVRDEGIEARVEAVTVTAGGDEVTAARVTASFPGHAPIDMPVDPIRDDAYPLSIGIGHLGPGDADPVVIVEGYSGGAHCCATFAMAALVDGAVVPLWLPPIDGSPATEFPTDIDGDGVADIRRTDDGFLYAFASYAASVPVPRIWNLRGGRLVDVSAEPRFASVWRELADEALPACADQESAERNGACAAYAAAKARLGEAEDGVATAVKNAAPSDWLPESCSIEPGDGVCPDDKKVKFASFEQALRWMLADHGYIDLPPPPAGGTPPASEVPIDRAAPVLDQEGVGPAEVPAAEKP